jgi:hypothetical protein
VPLVELAISLPPAAWIGQVSRTYPDARFRVLTALPNADGGIGLLEVVADNAEAVLAAIVDTDLRALTVLSQRPSRVLIQFETASPTLLRAVQSSGTPIQFPFQIRDGEVDWELTISHDRLSSLRAELDARDIDYRLERVRGANVEEDVLTAHQREVLDAAIAAGYYEQPRGTSLTDLASGLDMAKSTLSGVLRRAEAALVTSYADDRRHDPSSLQEKPGSNAVGSK